MPFSAYQLDAVQHDLGRSSARRPAPATAGCGCSSGCGSAPNTVMSYRSGAIFSSSSSVRTPAMPLPTITSLCFLASPPSIAPRPSFIRSGGFGIGRRDQYRTFALVADFVRPRDAARRRASGPRRDRSRRARGEAGRRNATAFESSTDGRVASCKRCAIRRRAATGVSRGATPRRVASRTGAGDAALIVCACAWRAATRGPARKARLRSSSGGAEAGPARRRGRAPSTRIDGPCRPGATSR